MPQPQMQQPQMGADPSMMGGMQQPQMPAQDPSMMGGMQQPQMGAMDPSMMGGMPQPQMGADPSMMGGAPGGMPADPSMGGMPQPEQMGGEEDNGTPKQSIYKKTGEISQLASQAKTDQADPFSSPDAKWALNMLVSAVGDALDTNDKKDVVKALNKAGNVDPNMGMGGGDMSQGMPPMGGDMSQGAPPMGGGMPQAPAQQPMMAHRNPRPVMESYDDVINEIVGELLIDKERHTKRPERKITNKKVKRTNPFVSEF